MEQNCIFCKIVKGEIPSRKVYEDDNFIGILDANPVTEGHTLIISKKHFANILDMPSTLGNELIEALKKVSLGLIKKYNAEGFNCGINTNEAAGQIIFHLHAHIIPRKKGDGIRLMHRCEDKNDKCCKR